MTAGAEYWDSQAATFDEQPDHGLRDPAVRAAWRRLLLPQLPPAPAMIADLGCGTGSLSVLLAAAGYTVTGLDIAPEMIKAARAKAAGAGASARFAVSDAASPALPAERFDAVVARHVLWAMPDVDEALGRWIRLLRPGGALVLIEGRWHTGTGLTADQAAHGVRRHRAEATVTRLNDPLLWGGPVTDERYLLISSRLLAPLAGPACWPHLLASLAGLTYWSSSSRGPNVRRNSCAILLPASSVRVTLE